MKIRFNEPVHYFLHYYNYIGSDDLAHYLGVPLTSVLGEEIDLQDANQVIDRLAQEMKVSPEGLRRILEIGVDNIPAIQKTEQVEVHQIARLLSLTGQLVRQQAAACP